MIVAGIDTATAATAAAVLATDAALAVERRDDPAPGRRPRHAERLLALLAGAMAEAGVGWADIDRLAVGTGPGGFTGLRIGVATARALAQAQRLPVVPVSSLEALALEALPAAAARPVLAVVDARRGEVFTATYGEGGAVLRPAEAIRPTALAERLREEGPVLAVGDGAMRFRTELESSGAEVPPDGAPLHRVSALAVCRLGAGGTPAAGGTVVPEYLRRPDAVPRKPV